MANYIIGSIDGIEEGATFLNRRELRDAGIHLALEAGIDGNQTVGASSIVLSGGYKDDFDKGDEILYTGHGGKERGSTKQNSDQSWDAIGNKALVVSEMHGIPIRVTRGYKHKSPFSPSSGYQYAGLYSVIEHFEDKGKEGFSICRFRLEKVTPLTTQQSQIKKTLTGGSDTTTRVPTTVLRIVRDTKLCRDVKALYDYTCQVCGERISVRGIPYAEAAHIRPLGEPHNGRDRAGNIICLCPNHHVMFDKGAFSIKPDLTLIGVSGSLVVHLDHKIDIQNLAYHQEHIFIDD